MPDFPDRLPGEPSLWHRRLCDYCAQSKRSLSALYQAGQERRKKAQKGATIPASWNAAITQWNWHARVALYDAACASERAAHLDALRRAEIESERAYLLKEAAWKRELAHGVLSKLTTRIQSLDAASIEPQQVSGLMRALATLSDSARDDRATALGTFDVLRTLEDTGNGDDEPTEPAAPAPRLGE